MKQRQLLTYRDVKKTKKQHTSPCSDCPWARKSIKGWLGSNSPECFVALAHGEGTQECHTTNKLCAGLAIYRANVCKSPRDENQLRLSPDNITVFSSPTEFLSHHRSSLLQKPTRAK